MRLTAIKQQRRDRERVSLFLDDEFWTGISKRLFESLRLRVDDVISEQLQTEIELAIVEDNALGYALNLLATRPLTEAKLTEKLRGRDLSEQVIGMTVARCYELHLLDDRQWAADTISFRRQQGQGRRKVAERLRDAGIDPALAKELLDESFDPATEADDARAALIDRYGEDSLDPVEQRRAFGFLQRRGFSPGAARDAVAKSAMSSAEQEDSYGADQAAAVLRKRYGRSPLDEQKAFPFLARRGFSFAAIKEALKLHREMLDSD